MRYAILVPVLFVLLISDLPVLECQAPATVDDLKSPTSLDLLDVAWRPVQRDSYALIAGNGGALLRFTGRFFINLSPNITGALNGIGWHPSGSDALIVGDEGTVLDFDGQKIISMPQNSSHRFEDVKWRPQGDCALIAGHNGTVFKYSGGIFTRLQTNISQPITCVAWRPDGRIAILCGDFPFVLRYDPETDAIIKLETGGDQYFLRFAAWRPDGSAALVMGTLGILFRYDGTNFTPLGSPTANQWLGASWSPDNRTALLSARGGLLYQYTDGGGAFAPIATNTTASIAALAYNLNGSYAIGVGDDGLVVRYPPSEKPGPGPTPDDGEASRWLLVSAALLMAASVATVVMAFLMVRRSRKKARDGRELEEAEAHAAKFKDDWQQATGSRQQGRR
jgi:hypothetical protein